MGFESRQLTSIPRTILRDLLCGSMKLCGNLQTVEYLHTSNPFGLRPCGKWMRINSYKHH